MASITVLRKKKVLQQLKKEKGDLVFLQETHLTQEEHKKLSKITNAQVFSSSYSSARRGVATIIKAHIRFEKTKYIKDREGRFVLVVGKMETTEISLMNVYYLPDVGPEFMTQMTELIITQGKGVIIIGWDFNLVLNPNMDSTAGTHKVEQTATILRRTGAEIGLMRCMENITSNNLRLYIFLW